MKGHRTHFRENGDLPPWRGSDAKKYARANDECNAQ